MSSAGPSRPRVLTLTADQLLGTSLTPARPHKQNKNVPRVLTIEDLLGTGLTVARPSPRPAPKPAARPAPRPAARASASTRSVPNPRLVRVTADEVLRTGIPVRTLQAVKARSGQAQVLTAEELLAAGSSRSPARGPLQVRGRAISVTAEQLAGSSGGGSSSRGDGSNPIRAGASSSQGAGNPSASGSRGTRPAPGQTSSDNQASAAAAQSRNPRAGQGRRRSASLGSMRTLPIYTQEPGESEVVIDRGATELEDDDEIPITVMSPVDENEPNADGPASAGPTSSPPGSPSPTDGTTPVRQLSPVDLSEPEPSSLPGHLPPWTSLHADAAPSYEAAMSTPNLHMYTESPANIPLPSSPILIPAVPNSSARVSEVISSSPESPPQRSTVRIQTSPSSSPSHNSPPARGTISPASPDERANGTDTPRRRFGFMALFHSRSSSRLRSRSHSHSHASPPPPLPGSRAHSRADSAVAAATPRRVGSPDLAPPSTRPFHRLSQSASGSMLDLISRSRADN